MLICKDIVVVNDKATKTVLTQEYERLYPEFPANHPVVEKEKTVDGKPVMLNGFKWVGTQPDKSVAVDVAVIPTLLKEALAKIQELYPGTPEAPTNPYQLLLQFHSYGMDLDRRNEIQGKLRPSKPITKEAALDNIVKQLVKSGMSLEKAQKRAKLMLEDDDV